MTERNSHGNYHRTPQGQWQSELYRPDPQEENTKVILNLVETFASEKTAKSWTKRREDALKKPGGLERAITAKTRKSVADCISDYIDASPEGFGKSKSQMLSYFQRLDFGASARL